MSVYNSYWYICVPIYKYAGYDFDKIIPFVNMEGKTRVNLMLAPICQYINDDG